ncbi:hypothetical protein FACS1894120_2880 [Clostridia bacterium]|nr:hypothetical protein FACS1894120_2880 [Clostridia bacterium]
MELKIATDLSIIPLSVDFNYTEIKCELAARLERYRGMVVTEQVVSDAKKDRASLNSLRTRIDSERKKIKNTCLQPYKTAEPLFKELYSMITEVMSAIDGQLKSIDETAKRQLYDTLQEHWKSVSGDVGELVDFSRVFNQRWLNKTYGIGNAKSDITQAANQITADLKIITDMTLPFENEVIAVYLRNLNLYEAMAEKERLTPKPTPIPVLIETKTMSAKSHFISAIADDSDEKLILEITLKSSQKSALGKYFRDNGIKYQLYKG